MARGHQADLMKLREFAFGRNGIAGPQAPGLNFLQDGALDPLVGGHSIPTLDSHAIFLDSQVTYSAYATVAMLLAG